MDTFGYYWNPTGGPSGTGAWEKMQGTGGAGYVQMAGEGPATQARNRALSNVTTRQKVEWPAGANITYLTALATLPRFDAAFSGTAAAMGTTGVVSAYSRGSFVISGLTGETISVTGLVGAALVATAAMRVIDLATGALTAASALGNGSYKLVDFAVRKLVFTKSAAVENATVTLSLDSDDVPEDVYAVLCPDAENDTEADGNLGVSGNPPSSATADAQFVPIPLGEFVKIPLTAALVNGSYGGGRVDVRSVDGTALNIWIGAN